MKDKIIELYKTVILSKKNVIQYDDNILHCEGFRNFNSLTTIKERSNLSGKFVLFDTYTIYSNTDYSLNREDLKRYYNGHLVKESKKHKIFLDTFYNISIEFDSKSPKLTLRTNYESICVDKDYIDVKVKYNMFYNSVEIQIDTYEHIPKHILEFGSSKVFLTDNEYEDLITFTLDSIDKSNNNIIDSKLKEYKN